MTGQAVYPVISFFLPSFEQFVVSSVVFIFLFSIYIDVIYHQGKEIDITSKVGGNLEQIEKTLSLILFEEIRNQMLFQSEN